MAACYETLTIDQCNKMLVFAEGKRISRVWQGVEPAVFLELGRLTRETLLTRTRISGQATLMIESVWRVKKSRSVHFGSSFSKRIVDQRLAELVGLRVDALSIEPDTGELYLRFSDGRAFRTFVECDTQPKWTVLVRDCSLLQLDPVWKGVDVTPCFHIRAGRPEIEYCFDKTDADLAALKKRYRFPKPGTRCQKRDE